MTTSQIHFYCSHMPMPVAKDDAPVRIAVQMHKDGKPTLPLAPPPGNAPTKPGPGASFSALANNRRVIPEPPPPRTQLFNPIAPRPSSSEGSSGYLDEDEGDFSDDGEGSMDFRGMEENAERVKSMKAECLQKLHRYSQQGIPVPEHLGMRSSLEDLQGECDRIKRNNDTQNAIQFQRRLLVTFVSGVEWVNGEFDPIGSAGGMTPQLQGWSKSVMAEIDSFDNVFERLYEKYQNRVSMPPELELLMAILMSAVAFHMQNMNPKTFPMAQRHAHAHAQEQPSAPPQRVPGTEPNKPQPPPQPRPPPPPPPPAPTPAGVPQDNLTRAQPDPPPYIMQGPNSGLGGLPGISPMPIVGSGPVALSVSVPPGSADALLKPPELQVPPRNVIGVIEEIPTSPTPARKKALPRRKRATTPSEAGVEI